jgi:hypothetical protein
MLEFQHGTNRLPPVSLSDHGHYLSLVTGLDGDRAVNVRHDHLYPPASGNVERFKHCV